MIVFVLNVRHNIAKNMFVVVLVAKIGIFFVKNKCYSFFYLTCDGTDLCLKKNIPNRKENRRKDVYI